MVWDRHARGPAKFRDRKVVGLTEDQAREFKDKLTKIYIAAAVEAKVAMPDHQKARKSFHGDRERLKALRSPRKAELKTKK
jgi:hypothetical protein